jgi:multisubunit Na+/H+ antiporter MnhC subunit
MNQNAWLSQAATATCASDLNAPVPIGMILTTIGDIANALAILLQTIVASTREHRRENVDQIPDALCTDPVTKFN